jgi:hypothetical protein
MRSLRPLLLVPLAACAAPEHAEAPDFTWAWRAELGQPITLDPAQSDELVWSIIDAPEGSALWSMPTVEGSTFTFIPDTLGEVSLSVERCVNHRCAWGTVSVQVSGDAPSSQRLQSHGLRAFGGVKLPSFGLDQAPIAAAASTVEDGWLLLDGSASSDPDGDELTYAWTVVSGPVGVDLGAISVQPPDQVTAEVELPMRGRYTFQLEVTAKKRKASVKLSPFILGINDDFDPLPD